MRHTHFWRRAAQKPQNFHAFILVMCLEESSTTVIRVRASDGERARDIVYRYTDKDFLLADAISFAVVVRRLDGVFASREVGRRWL